MNLKYWLISVICFIFFVFSACTINVNQSANNTNTSVNTNHPANAGNTASAPVNKAHWSVAVCSSRTKNITLAAGPSENDSQVFATWKEGSTQKIFNFPERLQNLSSVFLMASSSDKNQVELCVLYDGHPKKRVEFDDSEHHTINSSDADDKGCRCTE